MPTCAECGTPVEAASTRCTECGMDESDDSTSPRQPFATALDNPDSHPSALRAPVSSATPLASIARPNGVGARFTRRAEPALQFNAALAVEASPAEHNGGAPLQAV